MNILSLPADQIQNLLTNLSDVIMVLDPQGVVLDIAVSGKDLLRLNLKDWQGKTLASQATLDSQDKLRNLLVKPEKNAASAWRHVNLTVGEVDVPLQLLALPQADTDQFWVFGRDLSGVSQMQRRLVESHQSMERDYLRLRHMEARYRLLFETVTDPVKPTSRRNWSSKILLSACRVQTLFNVLNLHRAKRWKPCCAPRKLLAVWRAPVYAV